MMIGRVAADVVTGKSIKLGRQFGGTSCSAGLVSVAEERSTSAEGSIGEDAGLAVNSADNGWVSVGDAYSPAVGRRC
jgi:hypothetical protein